MESQTANPCVRIRRSLFTRGASTALLAGLALALAVGMPAPAHADCQPSFRKISENGLGNPNNSVIWGMEQFKGKLYVGTLNKVTGTETHQWDPITEVWTQVQPPGFGNPNNEGTRHMAEFKDYLYSGTVNPTDGAEIWRTNNGTDWEQVMSGGFGTPTAEAVRALNTFRGWLLAGVMDGGVDGIGPGQLWRSRDGVNWEPVVLDGLGDVDNDSFHRFEHHEGHLYAAIRHTKEGPPQIWRTADGVNWRQVVGPESEAPAGFDIPNLQLFYDLKSFKNHIYVGTANYYGISMHRSRDGITWQTTGTDGMGIPGDGMAALTNPGNIFVWRFVEFEDALWAAVFNYQGGRLWKTHNGLEWIEMMGPDGIEPEGFGDFWNFGIRSLENFNDKLYIGMAQCITEGCIGQITGAPVWEFSGEACDEESVQASSSQSINQNATSEPRTRVRR